MEGLIITNFVFNCVLSFAATIALLVVGIKANNKIKNN